MSNEFTKLAVRHPVAYSVGNGVVLLMVLLAVFRLPAPLAVALGSLFGGATWIIWRPGGIGRRSEGETEQRRIHSADIVKTVCAVVVLTVVVVATYSLLA